MITKKNIKTLNDINLLKLCLNDSPNGTKSFRYYSNREFSIISNHKNSFLYYDNNVCVGYGHLDVEDKNYNKKVKRIEQKWTFPA